MSNLARDVVETIEEKLNRIERENAELKAKLNKTGKITLKIGQSGGVSVYGMGRFPVTLYQEQWERLLSDATVKEIKDFIVAHKSELKLKSDVAKK